VKYLALAWAIAAYLLFTDARNVRDYLAMASRLGLRGEAQAATWLYRIAVNSALLYRRKWRPSEVLPELPDPAVDTHQNLEDRERLAALRRAIAVLPGQDRLVITLLLEGLSYREIAEVTGLTVNYVGVKVSRIKQAIEHRMTEECHGPV